MANFCLKITKNSSSPSLPISLVNCPLQILSHKTLKTNFKLIFWYRNLQFF